MSLRNTKPHPFWPAGYSDTADEAMAFPGACSKLQNLIPDPQTKNVWIARPAAKQLTTFTGFTTPGQVSCLIIIGRYAYGLIASGRNAGNDEPFVYDIIGSVFLTVSGITAANTPATQATTGDWNPPSMAIVGVRLIITHPGYTGAGGVFFGWFDLTTPTAPVWNGGNTTGTTLPVVPIGVANFLDRAWFAVNPVNTFSATYFTDTGGSLNISSATQIITYGDNTSIGAIKSMPLKNVLGGIVGSLMVFKGTANGIYNIYQVTGTSIANIVVNSSNVATTTLSPWSVAPTPKGMLFLAPDGLRLIDQTGSIQDPIGISGFGLNAPFLKVTNPSRISAATNSNVYRISFKNPLNNFTAEEYWLDLTRGNWSGPHTFPAFVVAAYGNSFIMAPQGVTASLWQSDPYQTTTSTYVENSVQLVCDYRTALLNDNVSMSEMACIETEIVASMASGSSMTVNAIDDRGSTLSTFVYTATGGTLPLWDTAVWDTDVWDGTPTGLIPRRIDWNKALVYRRLQLDISANAAVNLRFGAIFIREENLGYIQQYP